MISQSLLNIVLIVVSIIFFFAWSRENEIRRDYGTELVILIHKYDLDARDLRRSLRHKKIRKAVYRNIDLPEEFVEKMKSEGEFSG